MFFTDDDYFGFQHFCWFELMLDMYLCCTVAIQEIDRTCHLVVGHMFPDSMAQVVRPSWESVSLFYVRS